MSRVGVMGHQVQGLQAVHKGLMLRSSVALSHVKLRILRLQVLLNYATYGLMYVPMIGQTP